jgi:hypothetical protein
MLAVVLQDVNEDVSQLPRRPDGAAVVALRPDLARTLEDAIEGARKPDRQALATAAERLAVLGLDEQVHMIALNAELDDPVLPAPERALIRLGDRVRESEENALTAERVKPTARAHGDLDRMATRVVRPREVPHVSKLRLWTPGPSPRPTVPPLRDGLGELQVELAVRYGHETIEYSTN